MERDWNMAEVSDGRLYASKDFVKAGCEECRGCSACCHDMGSSIVLDPFDMHLLTTYLKRDFENLIGNEIELNLVDGVILPNIRMQPENAQCGFLDAKGRCSVHAARPGICRLFPLGRIYEDHTFHYFLQVYECQKKKRTSVQIKKWLGIEHVDAYEKFIGEWHYFLKDWFNKMKESSDETLIKQMQMYILLLFYKRPYTNEGEDIYQELEARMEEAKKLLGEI